MSIGIYKITSPSGRIYIGQSINIENRFKNYLILQSCKTQRKLYRSFLKYNQNNHIYEIIKHCEIEELNKWERFYQDKYDVLKNGLNCILTETSEIKAVFSEETKKKISKANKGRKLTLEHRDKISKSRISKFLNIKKQRKKENKRKIVLCMNTNKEWKNIKECSIELNINYSTLKDHLYGKRTENKYNLNLKQILRCD